METRKYSMKENQELYLACNSIRSGIQMPYKKYRAIKDRSKLVSKEGPIYNMIIENNWEELFKNKNWLKIIILMQKIDDRNIYLKSFKIISQFFPGILKEPKEFPLEEKLEEKPEEKSNKKRRVKITKKYLKKKIDTYGKNYLITFPKGSD